MPKETAPTGIAAEIEAIFHPRSIAVVGASANPDTPGHDYLHSLQTFGYAGEIYPVNPRAEEILGWTAYPSPGPAPVPRPSPPPPGPPPPCPAGASGLRGAPAPSGFPPPVSPNGAARRAP